MIIKLNSSFLFKMCELTFEEHQADIIMHQGNFLNVMIAHRCNCSESTVSILKERVETKRTVGKKAKSSHLRLSSKRADATLT